MHGVGRTDTRIPAHVPADDKRQVAGSKLVGAIGLPWFSGSEYSARTAAVLRYGAIAIDPFIACRS